jgi:hypothetical protein
MLFTLDLGFSFSTITNRFPRDRRRKNGARCESGALRSLESAEISSCCRVLPVSLLTRTQQAEVIEQCR